jgi:hypothetical protein
MLVSVSPAARHDLAGRAPRLRLAEILRGLEVRPVVPLKRLHCGRVAFQSARTTTGSKWSGSSIFTASVYALRRSRPTQRGLRYSLPDRTGDDHIGLALFQGYRRSVWQPTQIATSPNIGNAALSAAAAGDDARGKLSSGSAAGRSGWNGLGSRPIRCGYRSRTLYRSAKPSSTCRTCSAPGMLATPASPSSTRQADGPNRSSARCSIGSRPWYTASKLYPDAFEISCALPLDNCESLV